MVANKEKVVEAVQQLIKIHYWNEFTQEDSFKDIQRMFYESIVSIKESLPHVCSFEEVQGILNEEFGEMGTDEALKQQITEIYQDLSLEKQA